MVLKQTSIEWPTSAAPSEKVPTLPTAADIYATIVEKTRVFQFLAGHNPNFEYVRVHLLDMTPFPTLEKAHAYCLSDQSRRSPMPHISGISSETSAIVVRYAYPLPPSVPSQTSQTSSPSLSPLLAASGFLEFKKVDILWGPTPSTSNKSSCALYLKVFLLEKYGNESCWNLMVKKSLMIADLIDWRLSQPDDIYDVFCVYGISSASTYFLRSLESATSAIGRTILPEHLQLVADALSVTGELFGLSPKGISKQMDLTSTPSPFAQACFSLPRASFIKAAKKESRDDLLGTLDAIAWGKKVPVGTGRQFDLIYSPKGHELAGPVNVYDKLSTQLNYQGKPEELMVPDADKTLFNNLEAESSIFYCDPKLKGHILKAFTMERLWKDILDMSVALQFVLHKLLPGERTKTVMALLIGRLTGKTNLILLVVRYSEDPTPGQNNQANTLGRTKNWEPLRSSIDEHLDEDRKFWVMEALRFHPRCEEKLGTGVQEIKVAYHPKHQRSRCFMLVRTDGTSVDFSYRKCVLGAAKDKGLSAELIQRLSLALFSTESL
ncbi:hypothetical protein GIB67_024504 [Kingdonia uniflora]|uniref:Uncharacterized protein n=1 Tax=Kingdonia uniflora TaxID=39325 RepID=A0A7J7LNR6_9MAGN|nr:hypothetical protein GIB67_024504 [Kingdonia uniflora]